MSQENVDLFRRFIEAFNSGDLEGAIALADPPLEFESVPSVDFPPDLADVQRGPEGFRQLVEGFWAEFDAPHIEVHELIDAGDQVVVSASFRAVESKAVRRRAGRISGAYGPSGTAASFAFRDLRSGTKPSKPPGCGSRRCRRERTPAGG
jgi:hypothetical protein